MPNIEDKKYIRVAVRHIPGHFDPTAIIYPRLKKIVVAYDVPFDKYCFLRLIDYFPELNQMGLLMVSWMRDRFRFLSFDNVTLTIPPGLNDVLKELDIKLGYDVDVTDYLRITYTREIPYQIKGKEKVRNLVEQYKKRLETPKISGSSMFNVPDILSILTVEEADITLNHPVLISQGDLKEDIDLDKMLLPEDFWLIPFKEFKGYLTIEELEREVKREYKLMEYDALLLAREKRSKLTLMDIAEHLFSQKHYFEVEVKLLSEKLGMREKQLDGYFRGYRVINGKDLNIIRNLADR